MISLANKLKSIYTSDDKKTVLELLEALIKEVEKYEQQPIYRHIITLDDEGSTSVLVWHDTNDTPYDTLENFMKNNNLVSFPVNGVCDNNEEPIGCLEVIYIKQAPIRLQFTTIEGGNATAMNVTITDIVKEI